MHGLAERCLAAGNRPSARRGECFEDASSGGTPPGGSDQWQGSCEGVRSGRGGCGMGGSLLGVELSTCSRATGLPVRRSMPTTNVRLLQEDRPTMALQAKLRMRNS